MKHTDFLRLFAGLMLLTGCASAPAEVGGLAPATQNTAETQALEGKVLSDLAYKSGDELNDYERERCKLDLYLPAQKDFATVVWFYGGGLESGEKSGKNHVALARRLAELGIACAVVDYRLSPKATYPAYVDDAAAATAWVINHVAEHGGDAAKVFVSGHSAGGFLAAAIGYDPAFMQKYGVPTDKIAGLMPLSPQVFTHFTIRSERGIADARNKPVIDEAAPAYHARPDAPPTLVLVGDNDMPTRLEECQYFIALLKMVKHPDAKLMVMAGRNHGSIFTKAKEPGDPTMAAMVEFIAGR